MSESNDLTAYYRGMISILAAQRIESAAKIAALENQLSESKAEHGKTLLLLNAANSEIIPSLERKCLIAEMALRSECGPDESLYRELLAVAEGKLPQIEVKP